MQCLEVFCKSFFHIAKRVLKSVEKNGTSCSWREILTEIFNLLGVFVGLTTELVASLLELVLAMAGELSVVVGLTAELVASLLELVLAMVGVLSVVVDLTAKVNLL